MDFASILGTALGVMGILGFGQFLQAGPAFVVLFGTVGAMLLAYPMKDIRNAFRLIPFVYKSMDLNVGPTIDEIVRIANVARKEGVLALEGSRGSLQNPLFKKSIKYVIDGSDPNAVREIIDAEINSAYEEVVHAGMVFEGGGAIAPAAGVVAAALGLLPALGSLKELPKLGEGLAAALVALAYGVGFAKLILIPWGAKLKRKATQSRMTQEVVKQGVIGILEGLNPHFLHEKLKAFQKT